MSIIVMILLIIVIIQGILINNLIKKYKSALKYIINLEELCSFKEKYNEQYCKTY